MEGEKIEQHSLRNQKLKKLGPVAMEIASKGAKIRYVFSHFLRRALPPVHIAIHRCATRGISCLTWMAWIPGVCTALVQLGVLVLRGWLGYVTRTLISGKYKCKIL